VTLLAQNPLYRPIVRATGSTLEHRELEALSSAAWEIRYEGEVRASGTATETLNTSPDYVVYEVTVPALDIEAGYELVLAPGASDERRRLFDVARQDYGPLLGLQDILAERPAAGRMLDQIAGVNTGVTVEDIVWALAGKSRALLDDMVRDRLLQLEGPHTASARVIDHPRRSRGEVYLRGWMVTDMDRLRRVERYLIVYEMYASAMDGTSVEDEDATLADTYLKRAKAALAAVGNIRIDIDQDGEPDHEVRLSRSHRLRRVQG